MDDLTPGAENVGKLLHVVPQDKVVIITDEVTHAIGQAIFTEINIITDTLLLVIEDYTERPATSLPQKMSDEIRAFQPNVSVYAATALEGELPAFRAPLKDLLVEELLCRHAHMPGINTTLMIEGMQSNYDRIQDITQRVYSLLEQDTVLRVTSPHGTDLAVDYDPRTYNWIISDGHITEPGQFSNLPDGEVFTCPLHVSGTIAGSVIGDYMSEKYGVLEDPLLVEIENGRFVNASGATPQIVEEFTSYVHAAPDNDRVGEVAIGTNDGLEKLVGNLLQDEKYPGFHLAFGHPYPTLTGAEWDAPGHIDIVAVATSIWVGETQIMKDGVFTLDV